MNIKATEEKLAEIFHAMRPQRIDSDFVAVRLLELAETVESIKVYALDDHLICAVIDGGEERRASFPVALGKLRMVLANIGLRYKYQHPETLSLYGFEGDMESPRGIPLAVQMVNTPAEQSVLLRR